MKVEYTFGNIIADVSEFLDLSLQRKLGNLIDGYSSKQGIVIMKSSLFWEAVNAFGIKYRGVTFRPASRLKVKRIK